MPGSEQSWAAVEVCIAMSQFDNDDDPFEGSDSENEEEIFTVE